ncbi:hypothetical protein IFM89_004686 [Coptis chinensis]|uniref:Acyl carrier protein n=1 Tax=Coptis chinensis TaxID=261450 RepID=A0A835LDE7_9MAGN|nr:hypothetical protein IFM89_004686 [Coptis chinensis]
MSSSDGDGSMGITPSPSPSELIKSDSFSKYSSNPSVFFYGPGESDSRSSKSLVLADYGSKDSVSSGSHDTVSKGSGSSSSGFWGSGDSAYGSQGSSSFDTGFNSSDKNVGFFGSGGNNQVFRTEVSFTLYSEEKLPIAFAATRAPPFPSLLCLICFVELWDGTHVGKPPIPNTKDKKGHVGESTLPFPLFCYLGHACIYSAKPETVEKVCEIVRKQLALPADSAVSGESKFASLGADSLDTVEIVMGLEEAFGISVEEESAQTIATVQDAADLIENLIEKKV